MYSNIITGNPELVWVVPKGVRLPIHRRKSNYAGSTPALSIFYFNLNLFFYVLQLANYIKKWLDKSMSRDI